MNCFMSLLRRFIAQVRRPGLRRIQMQCRNKTWVLRLGSCVNLTLMKRNKTRRRQRKAQQLGASASACLQELNIICNFMCSRNCGAQALWGKDCECHGRRKGFVCQRTIERKGISFHEIRLKLLIALPRFVGNTHKSFSNTFIQWRCLICRQLGEHYCQYKLRDLISVFTYFRKQQILY